MPISTKRGAMQGPESYIQMPFGQYKGTPIKDLPVDYLAFLLDGGGWEEAFPHLLGQLQAEWKRRR